MEFTPSTLPVYCKYNLGKFLKYITFSSCSLIIFESLPKLYLKNCFFSIKCQNGGGKFHPRSGSTGRFSPSTSYVIALEHVGVVRALRVNLASEKERSRFCWLQAFSPRVQLFITVFLLLHYVCKCRQLHNETFITRNRINVDTKQNKLRRPQTAQPLSTNYKRGGHVAAKRAECLRKWGISCEQFGPVSTRLCSKYIKFCF